VKYESPRKNGRDATMRWTVSSERENVVVSLVNSISGFWVASSTKRGADGDEIVEIRGVDRCPVQREMIQKCPGIRLICVLPDLVFWTIQRISLFGERKDHGAILSHSSEMKLWNNGAGTLRFIPLLVIP
jgi:hypothetical protein